MSQKNTQESSLQSIIFLRKNTGDKCTEQNISQKNRGEQHTEQNISQKNTPESRVQRIIYLR